MNGDAMRRGGRQAEISEESLTHVLAHGSMGVVRDGPDLRIIWASNLPDVFAQYAKTGASGRDYLPHDQAGAITLLKREVLESGEVRRSDLVCTAAGRDRHFDLVMELDRGSDQGQNSVLTTIVETTEAHRRDVALGSLIREVSHRSKNLLAILQGVASQTARHSLSLDAFLVRFRGRLHSLATSQDLITSSNWQGGRLSALIDRQLERYCSDLDRTIVIEGDDLVLNPNAVLYLGLALHELAVNSANYGLFSKAGSGLKVATETASQGSDTLSIIWDEPVTIETAGLRESGFGAVALQQVVPASLDGSASWSVSDNRVVYTITAPAANLLAV